MTKILEFIRAFVMCESCGNQEIGEFTDADFAEDLDKKGWRVSRSGKLNCPKCLNKIKSRKR